MVAPRVLLMYSMATFSHRSNNRRFKAADSAKRALTQVNGQNLLGQALKVGLVHKNTPIEPQGRGGRGERGGRGGYGGSSYIAGEVDLDDDSSLSLNSSGRAALMAKLVHDNDLLNPQARRPTASQCLCLKNMFSLNDPDIGYVLFIIYSKWSGTLISNKTWPVRLPRSVPSTGKYYTSRLISVILRFVVLSALCCSEANTSRVRFI